MSSKSKINALTFALAVCAALLPLTGLAHIPIPPKEPTEIGRRLVNTAVADFRLTDQDGKAFRFASARGKLVLVTFVFTSCPDVCPLFTANFAAIQRMLDDKNIKDYFLLTITTDPEHDSAAVLKDYGERLKARFEHWSFLTGTRAELSKVWKIFGVNVTRTESGQVQHTSFTTLIDRQGKRRVDYYGDKWRDKDILKDIQWLRTQKPQTGALQ
ncbi:MAG TPA: SCO family protein [Candidatus Binatia bacterium]|nr:SCO family protein [Candidatus Binatia bacterium]